VVGPPNGPPGCARQQDCTFWNGGTLTGSTYTQSVTVNGLNGKGNWTFTYNYVITPTENPVPARTAWYLFQDNANTVTAGLPAAPSTATPVSWARSGGK
jgi:hypothetical protein